jgi:hypothetical protein
MITENTKSQVRTLVRKLKEENFHNIRITKCNGYIQQLEYIKDLLYQIGYEWVEDMEEIEEAEENMFGEIDQEAVMEVMEQVFEQADLIMTRLGLEEEELTKLNSLKNLPMNISINPTFSQNTNISISNKINNLYQEFEKELNKSSLNKPKLLEIVHTILKLLGHIL